MSDESLGGREPSLGGKGEIADSNTKTKELEDAFTKSGDCRTGKGTID